MKAFVVLAAVLATAAAEADPALLYSGLGYHGLGYAGYGYAGLGYAAPLAYAHAAYTPYGIKDAGTFGKVYSNDAVGAAGYAAKGQYVANSAGVVHVAKREAEADPALLYSGLGYAHAAPLAYTTYAAPIAVGKSAPCVNAANVPVPCNAHGSKGTNRSLWNYVNGGAAVYGYPYAYGLHHLGKREAEAEPALVYSGLHGYGYAGLPYATTYAAPLVHSSHVGLCLNYVGQRVPC